MFACGRKKKILIRILPNNSVSIQQAPGNQCYTESKQKNDFMVTFFSGRYREVKSDGSRAVRADIAYKRDG